MKKQLLIIGFIITVLSSVFVIKPSIFSPKLTLLATGALVANNVYKAASLSSKRATIANVGTTASNNTDNILSTQEKFMHKSSILGTSLIGIGLSLLTPSLSESREDLFSAFGFYSLVSLGVIVFGPAKYPSTLANLFTNVPFLIAPMVAGVAIGELIKGISWVKVIN